MSDLKINSVSSNSQSVFLKNKPLSRLSWWILFVAGTYVMSLCFERFRVFTLTPTGVNAGWLLVVLVMMSQILFVMVYDSYVQEKIKGRIQKPFVLFEWLIEKRFLLKPFSKKDICKP